MNKLLVAIGLSVVGHIIAFFHMNGQFRWEFMKSQWWIVLAGSVIYSTIQRDFHMNILVTCGISD